MLLQKKRAVKRPLSILLGCLLAVSLTLVGCGASDSNSQASSSASSSPSSPASSPESSPSAESPAPSEQPGPRTLQDAMGNEVQIPAEPQRIIAPFLEDPLTALGVLPVAQWSAGGDPQAYLKDKLQDVPPLHMDTGLQMEEVLGFNPDLIILSNSSYLKTASYEEFSRIAPTFVLSADTQDWRDIVLGLGELLGKQTEAEQALQDHDRKLAEAKQQIQAAVGDKTAVLLQGNDEKEYKLFGTHFYGGAVLYGELGFKPPELLKGDYDTYSVETLPELQEVDYIFVLSGPGRAKPPEENSLWQNLPAVKEGRVFPIDSGHWFNQNVIADEKIAEDVLRYVVQ